MNDKRVMILVIFVFAIILLGCGIYLFKANINNETNGTGGLTSDKKYKDLIIEDIEIVDDEYEGQVSKQLTFSAYNNSSKSFEKELVKITFLDKNDKTVCKTYAYIPTLKKRQSTKISVIIESECTKAYTFKIEEKEKGEINEVK